jgi:hypothetical protein
MQRVPPNPDSAGAENPNHYFNQLSHEQQKGAIRRMARDGHSEHQIASATRLNIAQIRAVLSERSS